MKTDKWGFNKIQEFQKNNESISKFSFFKETINPNIKMWVIPKKVESGKIVYIVVKSTYDETKEFDNRFLDKTITQFDKAPKAKEWINIEYKHMF